MGHPAATWFRKAAEQGNPSAQISLGMAYGQGHGVPQNDAQSIAWYRKAAEQGIAEAQAKLGVEYILGHGVPQNYAEAYFWLDLGASGKVDGVKQEDTDKLRDYAAKRLTPTELIQAQERAKKWFEDHPVQTDK